MAHQQREPEAWRRYVESEQLVSAMNATKWRETTEAMRHLEGGPPGFRIKEIWSPRHWPDSYWDREWFYHPRPWEEIEWMEIEPDARRDEIMAALKSIGTPFSVEEGHIRIWGWLRPGVWPEFA
jgi:hypothetical protein